MGVMKEIAVDLEKENQHQMVKELENGVTELIGASDDCTYLSSAIDSIKNNYQPGEELMDFEKLFKDEIAKVKASSVSDPQNHPLVRQFKEAIWKVHHGGQPMPGEEQEDIIMTSTESNILNVTCPLTGKPIFDIEDPVRSIDCKHIYEKKAVMDYIKTKKADPTCAIAGCPKKLQAAKLICDPLLRIEIEEARTMSKQTSNPTMIEDCTALDED
ncbi:hypothetical protein AQUCO_03600039v1 [Aquilegia coerulea]|nr:hypothetical protein AQUCO_03600039v1 [Aquilegia coerulea]